MEGSLSPIVIFTYDRPFHTQQILDSLSKNVEAKDSVLYIYCDGAKENATAEVLNKIDEVINVVQQENRFKKVIVTIQKQNKGLANSIIDGVTEVVNTHGKIIVLEDDLIVSPYFLSYMNDSLNRYKDNFEVGQIGACNFFACGKNFPNYFFIPIPDCLGWATWKDRWTFFNPNANELFDELENNIDKKHVFNAYGTYDFMAMLNKQRQGQVNSWAIRWQAVSVLKGWLTLYPNPSMTNHIASAEGTHANYDIKPPLFNEVPKFQTLKVEELPKVIKAFKLGYSGKGDFYGKEKKVNKSFKSKIKQFIPTSLLNLLRKKKKRKLKMSFGLETILLGKKQQKNVQDIIRL